MLSQRDISFLVIDCGEKTDKLYEIVKILISKNTDINFFCKIEDN